MPVIVVGADTQVGESILRALLAPDREVRAFVSDPGAALRLKERGVKVALGDISDGSHVGAACTNCFSAVLVAEAASDGREMAFATSADTVMRAWANAVSEAGVHRSIWVVADSPPPTTTAESATVDATTGNDRVATRVVELDDAATLS